jgi:CDP-glucose 4,6-dehydratase
MLNRSFWQGRNVFLTGHTGFKGSWLSLWLDALGAEVTGYALDPPTQPNLFELARVSDCVRSIYADIRDFPRLKTAIADNRPEVIIHLAAQSVVQRGYEDPTENYSSNVMGTVHLLGALRQVRLPCVVVIVTQVTNATRTASGSGDIERTSPWEVAIPIQIPKAAPNS